MMSVAKSHLNIYIHSGEPSYYKQKLIRTQVKRNWDKGLNYNSWNKSMTNSYLEEN